MNNYAGWLEKELDWIAAIEKKIKKDMWLWCALIPVFSVVAFGGIGLMVGGGVKGMLQNALIGIIFGIVCIPLCLVLMIPSFSIKRRCEKSLQEEVDDALSPEEKEIFARQMMGMEGAVKNITWNGDMRVEEKVCITKDYILGSSPSGTTLVKLGQVVKIETEEKECTVTTRSGGFKVRQTGYSYPVYFYYNMGEKNEYDKAFSFPNRKIQYQVAEAILELVGTEVLFVEKS